MRAISRRLAPPAWSRITVVGGGLMGGGIAEVAACANFTVTILEATPERASAAKTRLEKNVKTSLQRRRDRGTAPEDKSINVDAATADVLSRVKTLANLPEAVAGADLVIEAVVEDRKVKNELWGRVKEAAGPSTVFASNTSSLSIREQADASGRADRFGGLHFFSPVPRMELVEVVCTDSTSSDTAEALTAFCVKLGKKPIRVRDTKGFVVNRLLVPYLLEAARLVERGDADKESVDIAMKLGAGHPMGPFTLMDSIGLDVIDNIMRDWSASDPGNPLFTPVESISKLVKEGKLGRKTKEGFYKY